MQLPPRELWPRSLPVRHRLCVLTDGEIDQRLGSCCCRESTGGFVYAPGVTALLR